MKSRMCSWQIVLAFLSTVFFSYAVFFLLIYLMPRVETTAETSPVTPLPLPIAGLFSPATTSMVMLNVTTGTSHITFVGDIMLARSVEVWMRDSGVSYPFLHVPEILATSSAAFGNFEATIPLEHEPTKAYSTRFSANAKYIEGLHLSGITHVSLANNHAYDYGTAAVVNTRAVLSENFIVPFGDANRLGSSSITYVTLGSTTISMLAMQTVYGTLDYAILNQLLTTMRKTSDIQLAYIHWGTEYQTKHNASQEALANYLSARGIDAIIGHHPHVVEDIELVQGIPVFYSLGNFIFDQYFNHAVQQGLTLRLALVSDQLEFTLVPVTSLGTHAQPRLMEGEERLTFLTNLAHVSKIDLGTAIMSGVIKVPFTLQKR